MRDYLTNLAARSLERTPAIQPRLASLFEPLGLVGQVFSRAGRVGDRVETIAAREEAAPDALTGPRADQDSAERALSPLPPSSFQIAKESSDPASSEVPLPVSEPQHKRVTTTVNLAEPGSRTTKETHDIVSRDRVVSRPRPSEESRAKTVLPAIDVAVSSEYSHRDQ